MLFYNTRLNEVTASNGGYSNFGVPIRDTYVTIGGGMGHGQRGILYEPVFKTERSKVGVVIIHSDGDYSTFNICAELAKRGYVTFGGQVADPDSLLDDKWLSVKNAVNFLRAIKGVEKVVLMGHSGGATLMSSYQAVAENGADIFKKPDMIYKGKFEGELPAADGIMIFDSNWGNGSMTLFSVDPAVVEEGNGVKLDPQFDLFSEKNGFNPNGCSEYSDEFIKNFLAAQRERNNAIIKRALDRLTLLEQGKGNYTDDEPFIVTGGSQIAPLNKLFPTDTKLFAHTKGEYTLLHQDGSATVQVVPSVRQPRGNRSMTPVYRFGTVVTTVRHYLNERSVLAGEDYNITPTGAVGILWDRAYDCTPANVKHVHIPALISGMTGGYEYLAAEDIYNNIGSEDKTIAFIEGASHNFNAADPKWGDTEKVLFDYAANWLQEKFVG